MTSMVAYRAWQVGSRCTALAALAAAMALGIARSEAETAIGSRSGLMLPRFVSLKPDRVNVRAGPTRDHEVTFVYTRAGLPVEITAEADNWRRIRDWEGSEGWVYHSLLSGKRTALVAPKDKTQLVLLYDRSDSNGAVIARLQAGVLAQVKQCSTNWCRISGPHFDGWVVQEQLWGVYANETIP
jgi:SH3-like domain-containing protein